MRTEHEREQGEQLGLQSVGLGGGIRHGLDEEEAPLLASRSGPCPRAHWGRASSAARRPGRSQRGRRGAVLRRYKGSKSKAPIRGAVLRHYEGKES